MPQYRSNKIRVPITSDAYALTADLAAMADSANVIIPVASQSERDALPGKYVGMVVARTDLPGVTEIYDGTNWWKSGGPMHAEFTTPNTAVSPLNSEISPGTFTLVSGASINPGFATVPSSGKIGLPVGVYDISIRWIGDRAFLDPTYGNIVDDSNTNTYAQADGVGGNQKFQTTLTGLYIAAPTNVRFVLYSAGPSGIGFSTKLRIDKNA